MAAGIKLTNLNSRLSGPQEKAVKGGKQAAGFLTGPTRTCLLYTSPSPRDRSLSRMPSSA